MKKQLFFLLLLLCNFSSWAVQRPIEEVLTIAQSFFAQRTNVSTRAVDGLKLVAVSGDLLGGGSTRAEATAPAFYIYNNGESAYVIVSGDDRMKPVLGYSDKGAFATENLPENLLAWLTIYQETYLELKYKEEKTAEPILMMQASFPASVTPLLKDISWNQSAPYNDVCPLVNGKRSVTGCVATAMAMILKYHECPVRGKGTHTYTHNGNQYSFNYGNTAFDWGNMLPQYISGNYTVAQANAVAQLMYACGVAVDMQYSPSASGAYSSSVPQALIDYFGYDANMGFVYRSYFTSAEWMNMIKTELSGGRPIYYSASSEEVGHAFVFDGYDAQDMVHVNWGWGGSNNGYFEVASLNPSSPGIGGGTSAGGGFVFNQGMVTGLQAPSASSKYTSFFSLSKLAISKKSFLKGGAFNATVTDLVNRSTLFKGGQLGLIAEKAGKQTVLKALSMSECPTGSVCQVVTFSNAAVPTSLEDGVYTLYVGTKDARESSWSRARGELGSETMFTLVISGNQCTVTLFERLSLEKDLSGKVVPLHNLYNGHKGSFRMTLSNTNADNEFYGLLGVLFVTAGEKQQAVAWVGYTQLGLLPGTINKEIIISGELVDFPATAVNIPVGEYYICPGVGWGGYVYDIGNEWVKVEVRENGGSTTLNAANARLENNRLEVGDRLRLLADFSLSGTGNAYSGRLMAAIFEPGATSTSNLHYAHVFVEKGVPYEFVLDIDPMLVNTGTHKVALYQPSSSGTYINPPLCILNFAVSAPTGIEEEVEKEGFVIYPQPVENVLTLRTSLSVKGLSIYNLAGQLVLQQELEAVTGNCYTVPVNGLDNGYYVIVLQTNNNQMYRSKFMKK